jgi:hypothetical protein
VGVPFLLLIWVTVDLYKNSGKTNMRILVVFDVKSGAEQNLRVALQTVNSTEQTEKAIPQILICLLQMLREDKPLDDYLGEMERATSLAFDKIVQIVNEVECEADICLTLLKGMEPEAADLIANEVNEWQADQIFISLNKPCLDCITYSNKSPSLFRIFFKPESNTKKAEASWLLTASTLPLAYVTKPVSFGDLLNKVSCPIRVTCHSEVLFSMYLQHPKVKPKRKIFE